MIRLGIFDPRTAAAVLLVLVFTTFGLGRALPLRTDNLVPLVTDLTLLAAYLYTLRTMVRLPVGITETIRRARKARREYGLHWREALRDGFLRGVRDRRRWSVGPLALLDRLAVLAGVLLVTTPFVGVVLLRLLGLSGVLLLLILYLFSGSFALLVGEAPDHTAPGNRLPFLDLGE